MFEKIIGEEYLVSNIENNEYSYQKNFKREQIAKILGKNVSDKLNKNLDRRFYHNGVAVLVEKKQGQNLEKHVEQLDNYIKLEQALKTRKIVGILYDIETGDFLCRTHKDEFSFKPMDYYEGLFEEEIPKEEIYLRVQSINKKLHKLGLADLISRMMFTGLALVGLRIAIDEDLPIPTTSFDDMKSSISNIIKNKIPTGSANKDSKLYLLAEEFNKISLNESVQHDVESIYDDIYRISEWINSYYWDGKDAMAIFFNEFRRYAGKREHGQVFTPEIWAELMYKLADVKYTNRVLDAACGSGTFLTKTMSKMIREKPEKASEIKSTHIFGVEWSRSLYVLACVNMLMHKDGKTNIIQADSTDARVGKWIKNLEIDRVLMNPPFENQTGIKIVKNVLDNVKEDAVCAFILPDRTLYTKSQKVVRSILANHTLEKIIKMPENIWQGIAGVTTSIFIFRAKMPHANKPIVKYWIKEDLLVTVKNAGRQDVNNRWVDDGSDNLLKYWADVINNNREHSTKQVSTTLEYKVPKQQVDLTEESFIKTVLDRAIFENGQIKSEIDEFKEKISSLKEYEWIIWALKSKE
ncbi:MAG: N-6 DNA methylase [Clostridia bacterium]|nr:N-6 DNA methylase [Clostridia bacterium]